MKYLKKVSPVVLILLLLFSCSKKNTPENRLKQQLIGKWELVSYGGGFAGLPDTETEDDVTVEFTAGNSYKTYKDGALSEESEYHIELVKTALSGKEEYVLVFKKDTPYLHFTVTEKELTLSADHPDATYFKYRKLEK